jgi:NADH-quinone oxidoreductase subunit J
MSAATWSLGDVVFYGFSALTLGCALYAVCARNIVRAVFSLLGTFLGVAGLYGLLSADFLAVVQVLVYVGGVLVLMLFAVMLTSQIATANRSSPGGSWVVGVGAGLTLTVLLVGLAWRVPWNAIAPGAYGETTTSLGIVLSERGVLPLEVTALLLLAVIVGSVVVARRNRDGSGEP